MIAPSRFTHLEALSDGLGLFEHAEYDAARVEHGYCTDDLARLLVVVARQPQPTREQRDLGRMALRFLAESQGATGRVRNRRDAGGRWHGRRGVEDCWGRSVWAFGTAAQRSAEPWVRAAALAYFGHGASQRSPHLRAMAFAGLGAAEVLTGDAHHYGARALLNDAIDRVGPVPTTLGWPWPEDRLTYANAAVAEVLLAGGLVGRPDAVADGLRALRWLLAVQTVDGHLSPVPVSGFGHDDRLPAYDQQPIEIAALADACARAFAVTGDDTWRDALELSASWFAGRNDGGVVMWDAATGGGYDGLTASGPNRNEGAESTLALVATMQHQDRLHQDRLHRDRMQQPDRAVLSS